MEQTNTSHMKKIKILLVDDFDTMIKIIRNILDELGYRFIITANNGVDAWHILNQEKIDFIISDWNMPQMTGLELLKKVRNSPELSHIPFLMVIAEAEKRHILDAVEAKVNQYIIKPFTAEMLRKKIESALKIQRKNI